MKASTCHRTAYFERFPHRFSVPRKIVQILVWLDKTAPLDFESQTMEQFIKASKDGLIDQAQDKTPKTQ